MKTAKSLNTDEAPTGPPMDRADVGRFLVAHQDEIRRLLDVRNPQLEHGVAATDVVSSVIRRVDAAIERGTFVPQNQAHVWAFASTAARLLTLTKATIARRFKSLDGGDEAWREEILGCVEAANEDHAVDILYTCAAALDERHDRMFFQLLMRGATIASAAQAMGWTPENGRQRWMSMKAKLRERFGAKYGPKAS